MRRFRFAVIGIITFLATLLATFLVPGTVFNRVLSAAICTIFSLNSYFCPANLAKASTRVVAANPPGWEILQAQRDPGEFGGEPSSPPVGNAPVPPYPQQPGPNVPVRPDFDGSDEKQPNQPQQQQPSNCSLTGTWVYSLYDNLSDQNLLGRVQLEITQENEEISITPSSNTSLPNSDGIGQLISAPVEQNTTEIIGELKITQKTTAGGSVIYGDIVVDKEGEKPIFFVVQRTTNCVTNSRVNLLANKFSKNQLATKLFLTTTNQETDSQFNQTNWIGIGEQNLNLTGEWNLQRPDFQAHIKMDKKGIISPDDKGCEATGLHTEALNLVHRGVLDINPLATSLRIDGNKITSFKEERYNEEHPSVGGTLEYSDVTIVSNNLIQGKLQCTARKGWTPYGKKADVTFKITRISQQRRIPETRSELTPEQFAQELKKQMGLRPIRLSQNQINITANVISALLSVGLAVAIVYNPRVLEYLSNAMSNTTTLLPQLAQALIPLGVLQPALAGTAGTIEVVIHHTDDEAQPQPRETNPSEPQQTPGNGCCPWGRCSLCFSNSGDRRTYEKIRVNGECVCPPGTHSDNGTGR